VDIGLAKLRTTIPDKVPSTLLEVPFKYLDRKDREFVRVYERNTQRRYRARKERQCISWRNDAR
jgi:hypothetical protein